MLSSFSRALSAVGLNSYRLRKSHDTRVSKPRSLPFGFDDHSELYATSPLRSLSSLNHARFSHLQTPPRTAVGFLTSISAFACGQSIANLLISLRHDHTFQSAFYKNTIPRRIQRLTIYVSEIQFQTKAPARRGCAEGWHELCEDSARVSGADRYASPLRFKQKHVTCPQKLIFTL